MQHEMTILEVTLSLVVACLTIALCYLIGVLVICVKKIRTLEQNLNTDMSKQSMNSKPPLPVKVPKTDKLSSNSPKLTIPRNYLAHLDTASVKESLA